MKHSDTDGRGRHTPEDVHEHHRRGRHHNHHGHHDDQDREHRGRHRHHRRHGGRGGRPFDYGELRLLVMSMIAEQPRHGYELMRAIDERMGGTYTPSPGVIYPTLAWLEDMGYARVEADGSRKSYTITDEGTAFLTANRAAIEELLSHMGSSRSVGRPEGVPAPIVRGMENVKLALRLRLRNGTLDAKVAEQIASALDTAAQAIERS